MAASITPLRAAPAGAFAASLARASDAELCELLAARPELLEPAPSSLAGLAAAVLSPVACAAALDRLDRSSRQALEACCVLAEPVSAERLAAALGCDRAALTEVLGRLAGLRLVLSAGDGLLVNPGLRTLLRHPARLGRPVAGLLEQRSAKELAELARRLGAPPPAEAGKAAQLEAIAAALRDAATVTAALRGSPEGSAELARRVALRGPVVELGYSYASLERLGTDRTPTGWLLRRGLLVAVSWGVAEMSAEAAVTLRGGVVFPGYSPLPPPLAELTVDATALDAAAAEAALAVVADIGAVLGALGSVPAKLLRDGGLGVREVRRLGRACRRDEATTARLLELAAVAGLAGVDLHERVALPTAAFDAFLDATAPQRWRLLAEAWLASPIELSLAGSDDVDGKPVPPLLARVVDPGARERRQALAGVLAGIGAGRAATPESVAELADWRAPSRVASGGRGRAAGWQLAEAELIGIVVGAAGDARGAARLAASSFGRLLLAGEGEGAAIALAAHTPPVVDEIVLQADLTAVAAGELPAALRRDLELVADVESSGAATVYRFGEASLRRWFDAGRSSADLLELLARHAPRGVPQSLAYLVEDLGRRHGRVRVGGARSYVRAEDPALVAEVVGTRRLARAGLRALAPTVLVSDCEPDQLVEQLRSAGFLAAAEQEDGALALRRPPARRLAIPAAGTRRAGVGRDGDAGAGGAPGRGAEAVRAVVAGLRAGPPAGAPSGMLPPVRARGAHEAVADDAGDAPAATSWRSSRPGRQARPTQIAKGPAAVRGVLELAIANDWAVRLCARDGDGASGTREQYALPFAVRGDVVSMELPDGDGDSLPLAQIVWARILTEAEEEAHDLMGGP